MDEATNALDEKSEKSILKAIKVNGQVQYVAWK
jgi:ABC-type bacteriocin/lantibiotic exporter with double-glycine peptidase domain